jgi:hypothetical protein
MVNTLFYSKALIFERSVVSPSTQEPRDVAAELGVMLEQEPVRCAGVDLHGREYQVTSPAHRVVRAEEARGSTHDRSSSGSRRRRRGSLVAAPPDGPTAAETAASRVAALFLRRPGPAILLASAPAP